MKFRGGWVRSMYGLLYVCIYIGLLLKNCTRLLSTVEISNNTLKLILDAVLMFIRN